MLPDHPTPPEDKQLTEALSRLIKHFYFNIALLQLVFWLGIVASVYFPLQFFINTARHDVQAIRSHISHESDKLQETEQTLKAVQEKLKELNNKHER
jgi:cell division protein FtsL